MAEIISIKVNVNDTDYKRTTGRLLEIQKYVDTLNKTPIHIKIDDTGFEKATKQITAYNNSVARMVKAENELAVAKEKTAQAQAKAEAEAWKAEQQETRLATAQVNRHTQTIRQQTEIIKGENQIALQKEKTATVVARTAQEEAKANTALVQGQARLAVQQEKTATAAARAEAAQRGQNAAMQEGSAASSLLNNSLGSLVLQYVSIRAIISKVVSAFRDALNTMKSVDSELVTIQKTTGYSGEQLDRLTESAYKLASAYGRTATEILSAASVYARAGFKDNLEDMTELSALLQNVGDLSGEAAAKFLVATNAAWKMGGSYEKLIGVIDGLNQQTNEAAVDMEALTSGITVAGSVFSNAGESVQTFAGLLGAGVALTQRSGSEIGRGLRTIAMNIRQIKGELDDGEIIDEASISDAAKALHSVGISVADANGELRLTSDVLTDLAAKWGSLTTAEQSYISQSLAGKRQANILNALMNNWQEVERQMTLYANGAGSAMKENEIYLDSWEAKTKQLDAAWTEFVANLVDTDLIKRALDGLIALVNLLDSDFGHFLITAIAIPAVLLTIASIAAKLTTAFTMLGAALTPILGIAAVGVGIAGLVAIADALTTSAQEYADAVKEAEAAYARTKGQIEDLKKRENDLTEIERNKLTILQEQEKIQEKQVRRAKTDQYNNLYGELDAYKQAINLIEQYNAYKNRLESTTDPAEFEKLEQGLDNVYSRILTTLSGLMDFQEALGEDFPHSGDDAIRVLQDLVDKLQEEENATKHASEEWLEAGRKAFGWMQNTQKAAQATQTLEERLKAVSDKATSYDTVIAGVVDALKNFGAESYEVNHAMENLESIIPGSTDKLYDFSTATWKIDASMIASKADLLDFIDTQKQLEFSSAIAELESVAAAYWDIAGAAVAAMTNQQAQAQMAGVLAMTGGGASQAHYDVVQSQLAGVKAQKAEWDAYIATLRARSGYRDDGSGGNGYTPKSEAPQNATDEELVKRQKIVEVLKAELAFLQASGASTEEIVAKQKEIQAALHDEAEYLRTTEGYLNGEEDSLIAVKNLSTEWWNIQKDINKVLEKTEETVEEIEEKTSDMLAYLKGVVSYRKQELSFLQNSGKSLEEINAKRKEIQAALHDQAEYMRGQLEILKAQEVSEEEKVDHEAAIRKLEEEILALSTEWWQIQNDINEDLAKAEQERLKALEEEQRLLEEQKKLQQEMFDTLKKTVDDYYAKILTDKQEELSLEEKILAVQKAQADLANAQKERTVRYYNAATGQWEWRANAKTVKSAEDALKKAQDDLNKYQKDQAWKAFKSAWEYVSDQIKAGAMTFREAYDYMYKAMKEIQDTYGVDLGFVLEDSIGGFKDLNYGIDGLTQEVADTLGASVGVLNEKLKEYEKAVGAFKNAFDQASEKVKNGEMSMEDAYSYLRDRAREIADKYGIDMTGALEEAIAGMDKTNMSIDELWKAVIINLMKVNSARWFDANEEERAYLHAQNEYLGSLIGATYDPSGYWYLNGSQLYGSQKGVDVSGKSGYGESTGGSSGGGSSGSGGGSSGIRGAAGTGKYYDSYGNEYDTLDEAVAGNAANAGGGNSTGGKPLHKGTGFLAHSGDPGKISIGIFSGRRVYDAEGVYHDLNGGGSYFKSSDGYIYNTETATDYELAVHGMMRDMKGRVTNIPDGVYIDWDKLEADHMAQFGITNEQTYDSGGILRGVGGIKATARDEFILPPDITAKMMDPVNNDLSRMGLDTVRNLFGMLDGIPQPIDQSIGAQYNGDTYTMNGVTIGEQAAKTTTVYELARMAGNLGQYKGEN